MIDDNKNTATNINVKQNSQADVAKNEKEYYGIIAFIGEVVAEIAYYVGEAFRRLIFGERYKAQKRLNALGDLKIPSSLKQKDDDKKQNDDKNLDETQKNMGKDNINKAMDKEKEYLDFKNFINKYFKEDSFEIKQNQNMVSFIRDDMITKIFINDSSLDTKCIIKDDVIKAQKQNILLGAYFKYYEKTINEQLKNHAEYKFNNAMEHLNKENKKDVMFLLAGCKCRVSYNKENKIAVKIKDDERRYKIFEPTEDGKAQAIEFINSVGLESIKKYIDKFEDYALSNQIDEIKNKISSYDDLLVSGEGSNDVIIKSSLCQDESAVINFEGKNASLTFSDGFPREMVSTISDCFNGYDIDVKVDNLDVEEMGYKPVRLKKPAIILDERNEIEKRESTTGRCDDEDRDGIFDSNEYLFNHYEEPLYPLDNGTLPDDVPYNDFER